MFRQLSQRQQTAFKVGRDKGRDGALLLNALSIIKGARDKPEGDAGHISSQEEAILLKNIDDSVPWNSAVLNKLSTEDRQELVQEYREWQMRLASPPPGPVSLVDLPRIKALCIEICGGGNEEGNDLFRFLDEGSDRCSDGLLRVLEIMIGASKRTKGSKGFLSPAFVGVLIENLKEGESFDDDVLAKLLPEESEVLRNEFAAWSAKQAPPAVINSAVNATDAAPDNDTGALRASLCEDPTIDNQSWVKVDLDDARAEKMNILFDNVFIFHDAENCPLPRLPISRNKDGSRKKDANGRVVFETKFPPGKGFIRGDKVYKEVIKTAIKAATSLTQDQVERIDIITDFKSITYNFVLNHDVSNIFHPHEQTLIDLECSQVLRTYCDSKGGGVDRKIFELIGNVIDTAINSYTKEARERTLLVLLSGDRDFASLISRARQAGLEFVIIHSRDNPLRPSIIESLLKSRKHAPCTWLDIVDKAMTVEGGPVPIAHRKNPSPSPTPLPQSDEDPIGYRLPSFLPLISFLKHYGLAEITTTLQATHKGIRLKLVVRSDADKKSTFLVPYWPADLEKSLNASETAELIDLIRKEVQNITTQEEFTVVGKTPHSLVQDPEIKAFADTRKVFPFIFDQNPSQNKWEGKAGGGAGDVNLQKSPSRKPKSEAGVVWLRHPREYSEKEARQYLCFFCKVTPTYEHMFKSERFEGDRDSDCAYTSFKIHAEDVDSVIKNCLKHRNKSDKRFGFVLDPIPSQPSVKQQQAQEDDAPIQARVRLVYIASNALAAEEVKALILSKAFTQNVFTLDSNKATHLHVLRDAWGYVTTAVEATGASISVKWPKYMDFKGSGDMKLATFTISGCPPHVEVGKAEFDKAVASISIKNVRIPPVYAMRKGLAHLLKRARKSHELDNDTDSTSEKCINKDDNNNDIADDAQIRDDDDDDNDDDDDDESSLSSVHSSQQKNWKQICIIVENIKKLNNPRNPAEGYHYETKCSVGCLTTVSSIPVKELKEQMNELLASLQQIVDDYDEASVDYPKILAGRSADASFRKSVGERCADLFIEWKDKLPNKRKGLPFAPSGSGASTIGAGGTLTIAGARDTVKEVFDWLTAVPAERTIELRVVSVTNHGNLNESIAILLRQKKHEGCKKAIMQAAVGSNGCGGIFASHLSMSLGSNDRCAIFTIKGPKKALDAALTRAHAAIANFAATLIREPLLPGITQSQDIYLKSKEGSRVWRQAADMNGVVIRQPFAVKCASPTASQPHALIGGGSASSTPSCHAHSPIKLIKFTVGSSLQVRVFHGDILSQDVDVIINPANSQLLHKGGVAQVICNAAGPLMEQECQEIKASLGGRVQVGTAVVTLAYNLCTNKDYVKYIAHLVGPEYSTGSIAEIRLYKKAMRDTLRQCASKGAEYIAMPVIGAGIYCWPPALSAQLMLQTISESVARGEIDGIKQIRIIDINSSHVGAIVGAAKEYSANGIPAGNLSSPTSSSSSPSNHQPPPPLPPLEYVWEWRSYRHEPHGDNWVTYDYDQIMRLEYAKKDHSFPTYISGDVCGVYNPGAGASFKPGTPGPHYEIVEKERPNQGDSVYVQRNIVSKFERPVRRIPYQPHMNVYGYSNKIAASANKANGSALPPKNKAESIVGDDSKVSLDSDEQYDVIKPAPITIIHDVIDGKATSPPQSPSPSATTDKDTASKGLKGGSNSKEVRDGKEGKDKSSSFIVIGLRDDVTACRKSIADSLATAFHTSTKEHFFDHVVSDISPVIDWLGVKASLEISFKSERVNAKILANDDTKSIQVQAFGHASLSQANEIVANYLNDLLTQTFNRNKIPWPSTWTLPQGETTFDHRVSGNQIIDLQPGSSEWRSVEEEWRTRAGGRPGALPWTKKILKIQRNQNPRAFNAYYSRCRLIADANASAPGNVFEKAGEILMKHGTRSADPQVIAASDQGLDWRFSSDECWYGKAGYTAEDAQYSHSYRHSLPDSTAQMFLVRVAAGNIQEVKHARKYLVPDHGFDSIRGPLSTLENGDQQKGIMIYNTDQAYPEYIITYQP